MTSPGSDIATASVGATVIDPAGLDVGVVSAIALNSQRLTTDWLVVDRGAGDATALPAFVASVRGDGRIVIPFTRELVHRAPSLVSDLLSQELVEALHAFYELA